MEECFFPPEEFCFPPLFFSLPEQVKEIRIRSFPPPRFFFYHLLLLLYETRPGDEQRGFSILASFISYLPFFFS